MASIQQLPSGMWRARVRRRGHATLTKSFSRKLDADAWARRVESEQERGAWRDEQDLTGSFADLLDQYTRDVLPGKKSATVVKYHVARLRADLGRLPLRALDRAVLAEWRDARLRSVASATVNRELSTLGSVLTWARKDLDLPIEHVVSAIRRPAQGRARDRRLEGDEERRLLAALKDHTGQVNGSKRTGAYRVGTRNPWMRPLVLLALETAMRQGELLSLVWENVDLAAQTAHLEDTKNGESRTVPLSSRAVAVLEALPPRSSGMDERVFPVTAQAVKLAWKRATKRAGLEDLHFHDLRHEATSRLAEKLPNLIELAAVTGHKDLRMLKRYYHPRATDLAKKLG